MISVSGENDSRKGVHRPKLSKSSIWFSFCGNIFFSVTGVDVISRSLAVCGLATATIVKECPHDMIAMIAEGFDLGDWACCCH